MKKDNKMLYPGMEEFKKALIALKGTKAGNVIQQLQVVYPDLRVILFANSKYTLSSAVICYSYIPDKELYEQEGKLFPIEEFLMSSLEGDLSVIHKDIIQLIFNTGLLTGKIVRRNQLRKHLKQIKDASNTGQRTTS